MYCLAERHLSSIQKAIQSAHAIVEYSLQFGETEEYKSWAKNDKTIIVLDGGNVKDMDEIVEKFSAFEIPWMSFFEPDLDNIRTAIAVLVDERVYDTKTYGKNYDDYMMMCHNDCNLPKWGYFEWLQNIGEMKNELLKSILIPKRIAI